MFKLDALDTCTCLKSTKHTFSNAGFALNVFFHTYHTELYVHAMYIIYMCVFKQT